MYYRSFLLMYEQSTIYYPRVRELDDSTGWQDFGNVPQAEYVFPVGIYDMQMRVTDNPGLTDIIQATVYSNA